MNGAVTLRDGIRIALSGGRAVVADARHPDGDTNLLSHAHGDHLFREAPDTLVASELTLDLAGERRGEQPKSARDSDASVTMVDSGHVPGSRAFLIEDEHRYLYTGDLSVRDRFFLSGFDPPDADVLVVESTYGKPDYRFPAQAEIEATIVEWLEDTADRPVLLMGYALGRAQELEVLAERADRRRIFVTDAIDRLDSIIKASLDVEFHHQLFTNEVDLGPGDVLVLPSQTNNLQFVETLREETGAIKAGFSGWAIESSYRFARDLDVAFPLSDHADYDELLSVVEAVDPRKVFTVHGFVDELASAIERDLGYPSQALKRNQSTLSDF